MKKLISVCLLFFAVVVNAQKHMVDVVKYKFVTTAQRDAYVVPSNQVWHIFNSTTQQFEKNIGGAGWVADGGGGDQTAEQISLLDIDNYFTAENVESALAELGQKDYVLYEPFGGDVKAVVFPKISSTNVQIGSPVGSGMFFDSNGNLQLFKHQDYAHKAAIIGWQNSAIRNYGLPDKDGTFAMLDDLSDKMNITGYNFTNTDWGIRNSGSLTGFQFSSTYNTAAIYGGSDADGTLVSVNVDDDSIFLLGYSNAEIDAASSQSAVTKGWVLANTGGGSAPDIANQVESETGTDNTKMMTPLRVKQSIEANAGGGVAQYRNPDLIFNDRQSGNITNDWVETVGLEQNQLWNENISSDSRTYIFGSSFTSAKKFLVKPAHIDAKMIFVPDDGFTIEALTSDGYVDTAIEGDGVFVDSTNVAAAYRRGSRLIFEGNIKKYVAPDLVNWGFSDHTTSNAANPNESNESNSTNGVSVDNGSWTFESVTDPPPVTGNYVLKFQVGETGSTIRSLIDLDGVPNGATVGVSLKMWIKSGVQIVVRQSTAQGWTNGVVRFVTGTGDWQTVTFPDDTTTFTNPRLRIEHSTAETDTDPFYIDDIIVEL